jgi:biotin carboxylase
MQPKTLLLLGGSAAQVVAIQKAKELGYRTVLCDYLPDNPGQYLADVFYQVSTTNKAAVLKVAMDESIDGIVAYGSDPAAPTAAFVAEKLGLPGVGSAVADAFCEKSLFREFLCANGFNTPKSLRAHDAVDVSADELEGFHYPLIVKPTDSSGSKGVTVVESYDGLAPALVEASKFSRNGIYIIEEFIQRDHPQVIEAEIFAIHGKVVSWGLMNTIRDAGSNPLLPAGYSYPLELPLEREQIVRSEVSRLIAACGDVTGAFNIEMIIDSSNRLYFLDAGPRNGGNMLPIYMSYVSGKDVVAATLQAAVGDTESIDCDLDGHSGGYWGLAVLHSARSGRFAGVRYSDLARKCLVREEIQCELGEAIRPFERCNDLVGLTFFRFDTVEEMDEVMWNLGAHIEVLLDGCEQG